MRRPRVKVWMLMVAVAVVALAAVPVRIRMLRLRRADRHAELASHYRDWFNSIQRWKTFSAIVIFPARSPSGDGSDTENMSFERCGALADHFKRLEAKYRRAAATPWLPVEPDPPIPCEDEFFKSFISGLSHK
jgi:hypothetical protein